MGLRIEMERANQLPSAVRRVAIIAPDWRSLVRLRGDLIRDILHRRHRVLCLAPSDALDPQTEHVQQLIAMGAVCTGVPPTQEDRRLISDRKLIAVLAAKLADWSPHVAFGYQPKMMLLGALAARRARVPHVASLVSSLGPAFGGPDVPRWSWRRLARAGLAASHAILVHNRRDLQRLNELRLIAPTTATRLVSGAGVDLERHAPQPLPPTGPGSVFLMLSALRREKGVLEFCAAARQVKARNPSARFILAGPEGRAADALSRADLADFAGSVDVRGDHADIRPLLSEAHVVVVPSWREGLSRVLLEALANARPVIASDIPGCREAVDEVVNGILVPPGEAGALAAAMERLAERKELLEPMARASRLKAERLFDVREVNAALIDALRLS